MSSAVFAQLRTFVIEAIKVAQEAGQTIGSLAELNNVVGEALHNASEDLQRLWHTETSTTDKEKILEQTFDDLTNYQAGVARADTRPNQRSRTENGAQNIYGDTPSYSNNHRRPQPLQINREGPANNFRGTHTNFEDMTDGQNDATMEDTPTMMAAPSSGGITAAANNVSKETPVSIPPTITYGLQNTHTTILPFRTYLTGITSVNSENEYNGTNFTLRLNSIYNVIGNSLSDATATAGITADGMWASRGVTTGSMLSSYTNANYRLFNYPIVGVVDDGTVSLEGPWWRDYWANIYQYYTVLGAKYRITFENPIGESGNNVVIAHYLQSSTDGEGGVPSAATLPELQAYKQINWKRVGPRAYATTDSSSTAIISGQYKPGMIQHNVKNDGDVKLWTQVSTAPTLNDTLEMVLLPDPLIHGTWNANYKLAVNICVEVDYIVQFKDLERRARYPHTEDSDLEQILPTHALPAVTGTLP